MVLTARGDFIGGGAFEDVLPRPPAAKAANTLSSSSTMVAGKHQAVFGAICEIRRVASMPEAPGEVDVHDHDVGWVLGELGQRLFCAADGGGDLELWKCCEQAGEAEFREVSG